MDDVAEHCTMALARLQEKLAQVTQERNDWEQKCKAHERGVELRKAMQERDALKASEVGYKERIDKFETCYVHQDLLLNTQEELAQAQANGTAWQQQVEEKVRALEHVHAELSEVQQQASNLRGNLDAAHVCQDLLKKQLHEAQQRVEVLERGLSAVGHVNEELRAMHNSFIRREQLLRDALQGILGIGKRDMTNPKYDGYFEAAREALTSSPMSTHPTRSDIRETQCQMEERAMTKDEAIKASQETLEQAERERMDVAEREATRSDDWKAGYQAALTEVMAIVEDCDGDLDLAIFKIKQLTQALAEGRKG